MAFSIKNDEADQLVRELVAVTGETLTGAVTESLRERLDRLRHQRELDHRAGVERLLDYGRRLRSYDTLDHRSADEIVGYDEWGVPS